MIIDTLKELFKRDLNKLKNDIESYKTESKIWIVEKGISNSAGNLCLHLIGNLNTFIGVALANTSYKRQRDLEFSLKDISRTELLKMLEDTITVVEKGLSTLTEKQMTDDFPMMISDKPTGMEYTMIHLIAHLNYHLGQINYHRRLLDN